MNAGTDTMFANIGKIIAAGRSFEDTVAGIMHEIEIYFNPEHCSLLRVDDASHELFFAAIRGMKLKKVKSIRLKVGEGIAGMVAESQESYFVPDTSKEKNFSSKVDEATGFSTKSIIAVPLVFRSKTYGVIEVINRLGGKPYTDEDHLILKTIADFAAISLNNASLYDRLQVMAYLDPLTGALNRARLNLELVKLSNHKDDRRHHGNKSVAIALVDLDRFKDINDKHGHRSGDEVLIDMVERLQNIVREKDMVLRIGGDEFLLILRCSNAEEADQSVKRLEVELEKATVDAKNFTIPYSFSYGISSGSRLDLEELIHTSDTHMYKKKSVE